MFTESKHFGGLHQRALSSGEAMVEDSKLTAFQCRAHRKEKVNRVRCCLTRMSNTFLFLSGEFSGIFI